MDFEEIKEYCLQKKKSYIDYPFGDIPICFKVNKKLFAQVYPNKSDYKITLKCNVLLAELYRKQYEGIVIKDIRIKRKSIETVYENII